jgi:ATP-dependent DNA helicase PIF1
MLISVRNIGGTTLHGWAGIGYGRQDAPALASAIEAFEPVARRWRETDALLIEEGKQYV